MSQTIAVTTLSGLNMLAKDLGQGTWISRVWIPGATAGPAVVLLKDGQVYDISVRVATVSALLELDDPVQYLRRLPLEQPLISLGDLLKNSDAGLRDSTQPWLLAPIDLQAVKAAGVTFATSMLERVVEEQAKGDPAKADSIRATLVDSIGADLGQIVPGSAQAAALKEVLISQGMWSQYLEVGIGPDAEIFTKAQPLSGWVMVRTSVFTPSPAGTIQSLKWYWPFPVGARFRALRWGMTSIFVTSKGGVPCFCPRPKTTTHRPRLGHLSDCSMRPSVSRTCARRKSHFELSARMVSSWMAAVP